MPSELVHDLKCWRAPFCAVWGGLKHFEYRLNDRDFRVNDVLRLREYDEFKREYTGREIRVRITYILKNSFEVPQGYCIISLDPQMVKIQGPPF